MGYGIQNIQMMGLTREWKNCGDYSQLAEESQATHELIHNEMNYREYISFYTYIVWSNKICKWSDYMNRGTVNDSKSNRKVESKWWIKMAGNFDSKIVRTISKKGGWYW